MAATLHDILKEGFTGLDTSPQPMIQSGDVPGHQTYVRVPSEHLIEVLTFLKDDPRTAMEQLIELNGIDYLNFPEARDRFAVTYAVQSITLGHRLWLKSFVNDPDPTVPSITGLWAGAEWMEREVFDMFGIRFTGHPDLRRILTWEGFEAHPLRKDYPLRGRGEREDYNIVSRDSA